MRYNADSLYYTASAIKGPYAAWAAQTNPDTAAGKCGVISDAIAWSGNDAYFDLVYTFGSPGFNNRTSGLGRVNTQITGEWFPPTNAREFAILWCSIYDSFLPGAVSGEIRDRYTGTLQSSIYKTLGTQYTVYSKAGWIFWITW